MPFFSIIIKTTKNSESLKNAVYSVLLQAYPNFEIIIVNDSPDDKTYADFESDIRDTRIIYIKNDKSRGPNFCLNRALSSKSIKSDWVIFLEDTETLNKNTLNLFVELINQNREIKWIISNKTNEGSLPITIIKKENIPLDYTLNFLILKNRQVNITHCINKEIIRNVYFPKTIRQGYEWLFFYELSTKSKTIYFNFNSIVASNKTKKETRKRTTDEELDNLELIWKEGVERKINKNLLFIIYMLMRLFRAFTLKINF